MRERRITAKEVEEALGHVQVESPASSARRVNLWGETAGGRILRITTYRDQRDLVISVVAPKELR